MSDFDAAGIAVFALSYDPVEVLAQFAAKRDVTYTLLSDVGSRVIRQLGLLNEHLDEQYAYYGLEVREHHRGVPYPGSFILDEAGVIVEKHFEQGHRIRPTGVTLLEESFGATSSLPAVEGRVTAPALAAAARLSPPSYRPGQHLRIHPALAVAPGWHVYGEPIDAAYTPLAITVDPLPGLEAGPAELPPPLPLASDGSGEALPAYEGALRGVLPVTLTKHLGDVTLTVRLRYQACDATLCYPPAELMIPLTLSGLDSIRD